MIKEIEVKGFQAYKKKVTIKLSKGVNFVFGGSTTGKSSLVRSIRWGFQNRPQGDRFRNRRLGDKEAVYFKAKFSNNSEIKRIKSPSENLYKIKGIKDPLQALRTDVPEEVTKVTRMKEINFQGQHPNEQYYLLTDSPGQVAKVFNEVAGLGIVDKTIANVNSRKRAANASIKVYDVEIKEALEEIADTDWVPEALKEGKVLEKKSKELEALNKQIKILSTAIEELEDIDAQLAKGYDGLDEAISDLYALNDKLQARNTSIGKFQVLNNLVNEAIDTDKKLELYSDIENAICELISIESWLESNISDTDNKLTEINSMLRSINEVDHEIKDLDDYINKAQKVFNNLLKTQECPMCGRKG